jgi:putative ABC transport system ATP-binding protein
VNTLVLDAVGKSRGAGRRAVPVLRDVSLQLARGEIVLIEGPSGSGKTTLLTVAAGLLTADAGRVELAGRRLSEMTPAARREHRAMHVGFVFQRANLLQGLTAEENVLLAAEIARVPVSESRKRTADLFLELGLDGLQDRLPDALSGGEEHRVAIARAVVHRPTVVLADEPTGNLDTVSGQSVMAMLTRLALAAGTTLLIATHDTRLRQLPARVLKIVDGQIVGGPDDRCK